MIFNGAVVKQIGLLIILLNTFCVSRLIADLQNKTWHNYAYSGYAWCKKAGIVNPDPAVFIEDPLLGDDAIMRNAPFVGVALHRSITNWLDVGFSFEAYATFAYQKFHDNLDISDLPIENLFFQYQRQLSLQHQSAMLEFFPKTPQACRVRLGNIQITPLVGAAVGVGINNVYNFQAITHDFLTGETNVTSLANNNIYKSLAWRIETGIRFASLESNLAFGISYRYYCGGQFESGTRYMLNDTFNQGNIYTLPAWKGTLKTNQIKLYINVSFD